jgi:phosphatidylglycerophosphate synthase
MKKEKYQQLAHLTVGILLLFQAFTWMENSKVTGALILFGISIIFLLVAAMHKWMQKTFSTGDAPVFFLEAISLFYCGWFLLENGVNFKTVLFGAAVVMCLGMAVFTLMSDYEETHKPHKRSKRRRRHRSSKTVSHTID